MMFSFNDPSEFLKFANLADPKRYVCYRNNHSFYMLRPIRSTKNLDSAIYNGIADKKLDDFLKQTYTVITVSEITFLRE